MASALLRPTGTRDMPGSHVMVSRLPRFWPPGNVINPNETREDREWRVGIGQTVRLTPLWSLLLGADYATNDANLPNFRYQNTSVSAAVARTF